MRGCSTTELKSTRDLNFYVSGLKMFNDKKETVEQYKIRGQVNMKIRRV